MGRSPCCTKEGLKKGPWTQEEDEKLIAFVKEHGHGNWRSLPKKCGLLRCGKSCRLRWTNYLRPDIKRGLFTHSEQQKIIQLHALVGNKWAFIASQLPKRTDNEIKNYWNTVLKKRLESKVGLLSQLAVTTKAHSTLITPAAAENKSIKSLATRNNYSDMQGNVIKCSPAVMSFTHLAQWESARLEAEARLGKESQSRKAHNLLSFTHMGHSYSNANHTTTSSATSGVTTFPNSTTTSSASSSFPNSTTTTITFSSFPNPTTNPQSLPQLSNCLLNPPNTFPSSTSNPCLIHHPLIINYPSTTSSLSTLPINSLSNSSRLSKLPIETLSNTCSLSIPAIMSMPSSCSASNNSSTSSNIASSKLLSRLSPQESISSALTLGPTGRLSWQTKEVSLTTSSPISTISQSSILSQMLCKFDRHLHAHEVELKGDLGPAGEVKADRGNEQMSLEAISSMMNLNSSVLENCMDLNSTMENWQDLLFDVENSCSDVVSTNWKLSCSSRREEFTHDATSLINNSTKSSTLEGTNVQVDQGTLDLEGLNLPPFDSIMSHCEQYANQHSKELLWDTPTSLSVSSTS